MYGQFIRNMLEGTGKEISWLWLRNYDLKILTQALICPLQERAIRTNCVKYHIDKSDGSPFFRKGGKTGKTISHIVFECLKIAQKEY